MPLDPIQVRDCQMTPPATQVWIFPNLFSIFTPFLPIFDGGMHETGWRVQGQGLRPSLPFSLWRRLPFGPGGAADRPMTQYITQPSPALGSRVLGPFEL